jgi:glycosyltransferase involved in cell wall biosynthesis
MIVNILHVIDSGGLYGAEMVLLNLVSEQMRMGNRPVIASIGTRGEKTKPLEEEAQRQGMAIIPFRFRNGPNVLGAFKILRYAHTGRIQILHTHGYKADILLGFMPKKLRRLPVVSTVHGWTGIDPFSRIKLYEWMDGLSLRHMEAVCTVNHAMLKHPRLKRLQHDKVHVIRNGIPKLDADSPLPDDEITEFCGQVFTVASIGRLSQEKGYHYLLEAFSLLINKGIDVRLLIVGEGPERPHLEKMILRLGLSGKVVLPGYRKEAWRYLSGCDVFVLSSLTEGLPITLLEAMQMGVPVVVTAVGGMPAIIKPGDTGRIVPPGSPQSLAESIAEIHHDGKTAALMAQRAQELVYREYSLERMCRGYSEIYHNLLNSCIEDRQRNEN